MNKIRDNIYLGDKHDATAAGLAGSPVTAILNVAVEVNDLPIKGITIASVPMKDEAMAVHERGDEAVLRLNQLLDQGDVVLVHCRHGKSRSPHIVAETISRRENRDYFTVYDEVRNLRPQIMHYSIGQEIVDRLRNSRASAVVDCLRKKK